MAQGKESARAPRRRMKGVVALAAQQLQADVRRKRRRELARNKRRRLKTAAERALREKASVRVADVRAAERKVADNNRHMTPTGEVRHGLNPNLEDDIEKAIARAIRQPGQGGEVLNLLEARRVALRARELDDELRGRKQVEKEPANEGGEAVPGKGETQRRVEVRHGQITARAVVRAAVRDDPVATDEGQPALDKATVRLRAVRSQLAEIRQHVNGTAARVYGLPGVEAAPSADATDAPGQVDRLFEIVATLESEVASLSSDVYQLTKGF